MYKYYFTLLDVKNNNKIIILKSNLTFSIVKEEIVKEEIRRLWVDSLGGKPKFTFLEMQAC